MELSNNETVAQTTVDNGTLDDISGTGSFWNWRLMKPVETGRNWIQLEPKRTYWNRFKLD